MLLLVGIGLSAYAFPSPSPLDDSVSSGGVVVFKLVPAHQPGDSTNDSGMAILSVQGGNVTVEWSVSQAQAGDELQLLLLASPAEADGGAHTFQSGVVQADGQGHAASSLTTPLQTGNYQVSVRVVDQTRGQSLAYVGSPESARVSIQTQGEPGSRAATTTSSDRSSTARSSSSVQSEREGGMTMTLVSALGTGMQDPSYRVPRSGIVVLSTNADHGTLSVQLGFEDANPSTTYSVSVSLNGSTKDLGTMTTSRGGGALLQASLELAPGSYSVGAQVYDVSSFGRPVLVMLTEPSTTNILLPSMTSRSSATQDASTESESPPSRLATVSGGDVEARIHSAVGDLTIPVAVPVGPTNRSTTVLDSRFSVSVGSQSGNGLVIAVSGANVTGPRVLLVNLTRDAPLALYPALNVTLDGSPVPQASSALQVLNPAPGDPAHYVLVSTATGYQLLVSIPHFSTHLIQVAGVALQNLATALQVDEPLLAISVALVTVIFAAVYAGRRRIGGLP